MSSLATPLPAPPEVTVVKLANGLSCWIRPLDRPRATVAMCLHVAAGSLNEEESERGLSHLLEHLAFTGGTRFAPGALEQFFDSLGTRLGRHHNAFTGRESTCYFLSLPAGGVETLDMGLACLADFAYGMRLRPAAVETERRVILEEMRRHHEADTRIREQLLEVLVPGSRVARRHPLGTEEVVRSLTVDQIRSYYARWYRPDNSTLLIAGAVGVAATEDLLRRHFADWHGAATAPRSPDPGIRPLRRARAAIITDPDVSGAELRLVGLHPAIRPRTAGEVRLLLVEDLAIRILNQRLGALIREAPAAFSEAHLGRSPLLHSWNLMQAVASGLPESWEAILRTLGSELRRARVHSFPAAEVERAAAHALAAARRMADAEDSSAADSILSEMVDAVPDGRPPMSGAQRLALIEALLPAVGPEDLRAAFATQFDSRSQLVAAVMPGSWRTRLPAAEDLLELHAQAESSPVSPPAVRTPPRRLLKRLPAPGTVAAQQEDPELDLLSATLANGVCVHLRTMEAGKRQVFVNLTLAGGRIRERADTLGLTGAAALAFSQPATKTLPSVLIRDLLADKGLRFDSSVDEDAVTLRVAGDARELEHGLEWIHLLLTQSRPEESALTRWQSRIAELGGGRRLSLEAQLAQETLRLLTGDDPRFRLITAERAAAITVGEARQWLRSELGCAPLEAAIVGAPERGPGLELALRYLGSLPARPLRDPGLDPLRRLAVGRGPLASTVEAATVTPRAAVLTGWRAAPWPAVDDRHLLHMATQILNQRLYRELREKRGLTYNSDCSFKPSRAYPRSSLLAVAFYVPPQRTAEAAALTRELVQGLAAEGPTEAEMETARKQFCELAARAEREPKYWSRVLADCRYRATSLADLKRLPERFRAFTRDDLRAALVRYVTEQRRLEVTCLPARRRR